MAREGVANTCIRMFAYVHKQRPLPCTCVGHRVQLLAVSFHEVRSPHCVAEAVASHGARARENDEVGNRAKNMGTCRRETVLQLSDDIETRRAEISTHEHAPLSR